MVKIWPYFHKSIWVAILFYFQFLCPKNILIFLKMGHYSYGLCGFPFKTSKLKNDIYIKYKFSDRFPKVYTWLNMYYSNIRIITFKKVTTMSIWIILNNFVWTCKKCNFCRYWTTVACIYPLVDNKIVLMLNYQNWFFFFTML
jgi:hypothetical protein